LLLAVLLLEGLYLLVGNLFLRPSLGPDWVNRKPDKLELSWDGGWTVVPGIVHLRGLRIDAHAGRGAWGLELDTARAVIALQDLPRKCFRIAHLQGEGLSFWAQTPTKKEPGDTAAEDAPSSTKPAPSAQRKKSRKPWRIRLDKVAVAKVREVAIPPYRYRGSGQLRGDLDLELRGGPLAISSAVLELEAGDLEIAESEAGARVESLDLELRLDPSRREERRGRQILRFLSGRLRLAASETQLAPLGFLIRRVPSMDLEGQGSLAVDISMDHGRILQGSTLSASGFSQVSYLNSQVSGRGTIVGEVLDEGGTNEAQLTVSFDRFEVRQGDLPQAQQAEPHVFGTGARIRLTSQALDLVANLDEGGAPEVEAVVEIPNSEVPHLETYNRFLPADAGVEILQGEGTLSGTFFLKAPEGQWSGSMAIAAKQLRLKLNDIGFEGEVHLEAVLPNGGIRERRSSLSGTSIRIDRARFFQVSSTRKKKKPGRSDENLWWARIELPEGEVGLSQPAALQASFRATMRDSSPFLALVIKDRKSPLWLREALTVEGIAGTGRIFFRPRQIAARELAFVVGNHIELQGHLRFSKPSLSALLFSRYRKLSASVLLQDGQRDWDLVGSRKWFHRQEALWFANEGPEASESP